MLKRILLVVSIMFSISTWGQEFQIQKRARPSKAPTQRWGVSTALLIQNTPFREFASLQLATSWYAKELGVWEVGDIGIGGSIGFSYDKMLGKNILFRTQGQLQSTGWLSGIIDLGFGIRIPAGGKNNFSIEVYFSTLQTGGTLKLIGLSVPTIPSQLKVYIGMFGFKGRIAYEFAVGPKFFLTPYISYAAYPWVAQSLNADLYINGVSQGGVIDALQIGLEFGSKF